MEKSCYNQRDTLPTPQNFFKMNGTMETASEEVATAFARYYTNTIQ